MILYFVAGCIVGLFVGTAFGVGIMSALVRGKQVDADINVKPFGWFPKPKEKRK